MKTIGLIGGMSWESTITYYEVLNKEVVSALGGFHSAKILMYSVDFAELEANMSIGNWDGNAAILADAAKRLESAGADFIVIATNTMHKLVPQIEREIHIPILHIADATATSVIRDGFTKVALLGTKFTMTQDFIKDRLKSAGLEVIVPDAPDIEIVRKSACSSLKRIVYSPCTIRLSSMLKRPPARRLNSFFSVMPFLRHPDACYLQRCHPEGVTPKKRVRGEQSKTACRLIFEPKPRTA